MSGLRPVAAFFVAMSALAWIMVAVSVAKATSPSDPTLRSPAIAASAPASAAVPLPVR